MKKVRKFMIGAGMSLWLIFGAVSPAVVNAQAFTPEQEEIIRQIAQLQYQLQILELQAQIATLQAQIDVINAVEEDDSEDLNVGAVSSSTPDTEDESPAEGEGSGLSPAAEALRVHIENDRALRLMCNNTRNRAETPEIDELCDYSGL